MCGILGYIGQVEHSRFKLALQRLQHRGPDGSGIWKDESIPIHLGHRRLAILDLSPDGKQPMQYAHCFVVFNGEIYNFVELRNALEKKGYVFKTQTDTEVIIPAFLEWGEECLNRFDGMWALAIWDSNERRLILSRDRFGKKPLFYAALPDGSFAFASEMKALTPFLPEIKPSRDFPWITSNIFHYESTEKCLIEGIKRFPAAHYGIWQDGRLHFHRYWNTLDHLNPDIIPETYEDQVERFRELFFEACKIRMRADVNIGTALSGGLDSSSVLSAMVQLKKQKSDVRMFPGKNHAVVAAFEGTFLDEKNYALQLTEFLQVETDVIEIQTQDKLDKLEEYLYYFEELYITDPIPMMEVYGRMREKGLVVSMDGHGADEMLSGYGRDMFALFREIGLNVFKAAEIIDIYRSTFSVTDNPESIASLPTLWKIYFKHVFNNYKGKLSGFLKSRNTSNNNELKTKIEDPRLARMDAFNRRLYQLFHHEVMPTLLRNYDRYSMKNGVEIRMPFMDHRLVTYCFSLPWQSKLRQGYTKAILRDAMAPYMPPEITWRKPKVGFTSPTVSLIRNAWKEYFLDMIHSDEFNHCELLNPDEVKQKMEWVIYGESVSTRDAQEVLAAFMPFLWQKAFLNRVKSEAG